MGESGQRERRGVGRERADAPAIDVPKQKLKQAPYERRLISCRAKEARKGLGRTMNQHQTTLAGPPRVNGVLNVVTTEEATLCE